jgi:hypothetical protein
MTGPRGHRAGGRPIEAAGRLSGRESKVGNERVGWRWRWPVRGFVATLGCCIFFTKVRGFGSGQGMAQAIPSHTTTVKQQIYEGPNNLRGHHHKLNNL